MDWDNTDKIMLAGRLEGDDIQRRITDIYKRKYSAGRFKRFRKLLDKG